MSLPDGRVIFYWHQGKCFACHCVTEKDPFDGGSIMVWSAISAHFHSQLEFVKENLTAVIHCQYPTDNSAIVEAT